MAKREIPRILHQTWKNDAIPEQWHSCVESVRSMHPAWQYRFWTDTANRSFVAMHYPALLRAYDHYRYDIQRADAVRYCLLHHFGGLYIDLDIECLRPFDDLIAGAECLIVPEPPKQGAWLGLKFLPSNAFMASRPGHPLFEAVIASLIESRLPVLTHRDVLETTGPAMLARVMGAYDGNDVTILPSRVVYPHVVGSPELEQLRLDAGDHLRGELRRHGTFAVHYWANSWVDALAGELINPDPHAVPGYDFHPGLDSPGHDIANVGRDILRAASSCDTMEDALAFNTDGFVKARLLPHNRWIPMTNPDGNAGLYVKRQRKARLPSAVDTVLDAVRSKWGRRPRRV